MLGLWHGAVGCRMSSWAALVLAYGIVGLQIAFVVIVFTNMVWLGRLAWRVSVDQPDLYEQLGGHPLIPKPGVIRAQFRWLRFLYSGRFRTELLDPSLRVSAARFRTWYSLTTLPLVGIFLAFFIVVLTSGLRAA